MIAHLTWDTFLHLRILVIQNVFSTLKGMNSNLLNVFPLTEFEKFWIFFLKPDLNPKLHLLKLNVLLSTMVTIMVTICIVGKGSQFIWVFFHEHSQFTGKQEGRGYLFNSSLTLPPTSQLTLDISLAITTESSPLHIAISWTQTRNL